MYLFIIYSYMHLIHLFISFSFSRSTTGRLKDGFIIGLFVRCHNIGHDRPVRNLTDEYSAISNL